MKVMNEMTHTIFRSGRALYFAFVLFALWTNTGVVYGFDSGSTGADGPFSPAASTTVTLPPNGVFNYTTVNIPAGVTVTFTKNTTNTPVVILATGNITITGTVNISGGNATDSGTAGNGNVNDDGIPGDSGPGGFRGGTAGLGAGFGGALGASGGDGLGPGGGGAGSGSTRHGGGGGFGTVGGTPQSSGTQTGGGGGPVYGTAGLLPLVGGSGGGGGAGGSAFTGSGGGGGGGALLLASSGTITVTGSIVADGGHGGNNSGTGCGGFGNGGSGGAIRLVATAITGGGSVFARAGDPAPTGFNCSSFPGQFGGGDGRIRFEATSFLYSGVTTPTYVVSLPGQVFVPGLPTLAVTDIGGTAAPSAPSGSFSAPDITLPQGTSSPVTVSLAATNIPVGTIVSVARIPERGARQTVNSTGLSGTTASSTATANIALTSGVPAVVQASATFTVQVASNPFPTFVEGEKVEQVRVAATFGGPSSIFLITASGREVPFQGALAP